MLFRLYIGSNNATGKLEDKKAIRFVSTRFAGFTASKGVGYWQGKPEKQMVIEIETNKGASVRKLAKDLCAELEQQAVGVAQVGKMRFVS